MSKNKSQRLLSLSRVAPKQKEQDMPDYLVSADTVQSSILKNGDRRAFHLLMEAQHYWNQMADFRKERERNKRYTYGKQWDDIICVDGKKMTEEEYIYKQGSIPLKNNHIRSFVNRVLGTYRSQMKEPTCTARDRDEQKKSEVMSIVLQCNMQLNRRSELDARTMEEYLISGLIVHRKSYGWRNNRADCWTDYVEPNNFFIDNNMRDFRGWDVSVIGEIHDISFGELCEQFASSPEEFLRLKQIYYWASEPDFVGMYAFNNFGYSKLENYDFLLTSEPGRCRVIEIWKKEQKPRYRCHDWQNGETFKIDDADYYDLVTRVNEERKALAQQQGMPANEVPLITTEYFVDNYWYFYYLTPFGHILREGETPYKHGGHPYVFKAYPFIDGEIHSRVSDVIDQQRYINRLVTLNDFIMRASAKGALLVPEDCIPDGMSIEDFADSWAEFNGVIMYKPSKMGHVPQQIANKSTNIGISELLSIQLKFFDEISGVTDALKGKPGYSGESAAHYNQQTQNATMSLLDILDSFSSFIIDGAYKDVKNIQQFYDSKRICNIAGKSGAQVEYDPEKMSDVEFDLSINESTSTPAYRQVQNEFLIQLWQAQAISVEQLLEHGQFPFADDLLQSIKAQKEQLAEGKIPEGLSPQLLQQVHQQANPEAMNMLQRAMRPVA